ncbi:MAG: hypothetical protein MZW92_60675 [Comamonadaceae bacterium]|nr:hypothetical protein [Comamonadaceae bacterium]
MTLDDYLRRSEARGRAGDAPGRSSIPDPAVRAAQRPRVRRAPRVRDRRPSSRWASPATS